MKRSSGLHRIRRRQRSDAPLTTDPPISNTVSARVARRRSINSSRAKVAILKARAANQGQLHSTSRLCSNARSAQR